MLILSNAFCRVTSSLPNAVHFFMIDQTLKLLILLTEAINEPIFVRFLLEQEKTALSWWLRNFLIHCGGGCSRHHMINVVVHFINLTNRFIV